MNEDTRLRDGLGPRGDDGQGPRSGGAPRSGPFAGGAGTGVYAALDLGTNNCRLLIACPTGDGFRVVDSFSRIIRLGEGISATGCISDAAIDRAIAALSICRDKIHSRKARRLRLIATEACRAAVQCRRLPRPGRRRDRHPARGDRSRDRSDARRDRLFAAARSARAAAPSCSTSAAARPNWSGSSAIRTSRMRRRASRRGCRSRSASSRWPSISAARTSRRNPMPRWCEEVAQHIAPFAAEHGERPRRTCICSAPRAR